MSFNPDEVLQYCDHPEGLEELYDAALRASKDLPEDFIFIEIGTRSGGTALTILQAIKHSGKTRWFFTIDPYGLKPYKQADEIVTLDYDEDHYRRAMKVLADYAFENKLLHSHFRMKSLDWMRGFDTSEFWYQSRLMKPKFGFAYLDGDHDTDTVKGEYNWIKGHSKEAQIIVDDAEYLNTELLSMGKIKNRRLYIGDKSGKRNSAPKIVPNIQN